METFLNSSIETNDDRISIDGYNLIRADHPSDSKRGGVCIYYKEHIPLIKRDDICTLDNCLVTEIRSQGEKCFLTCIYCSPSQSRDDFDNFCTKFDLLLRNINQEFLLCSIVTGDFHAHFPRWWQNDITNSAGQEIDSPTLSAGYKQIIDKPTHIINNCHALTSYFVLTKIQFQIMELMFQFLINVTITLFLARLTSVYHFLWYISVRSGISVRQTWKILNIQYLILIGVKLLKIFP